jgi:hypothetical protein
MFKRTHSSFNGLTRPVTDGLLKACQVIENNTFSNIRVTCQCKNKIAFGKFALLKIKAV